MFPRQPCDRLGELRPLGVFTSRHPALFRRQWPTGLRVLSLYSFKQINSELRARPPGITALIIFFLAATLISFLAGVSLLFPAAFFEAMWRVNSHGHDGLISMGVWGLAVLFAASISCGAATIGLWRKARWGYVMAFTLIAINLLSDLANTISGSEPRAIVGVPIASALLLYLLTKRVRDFFDPDRRATHEPGRNAR